MGQLFDDIVGTANSFTKNFSDKGNFDYSIASLAEVDDLLDEMSNYELDEDTICCIYTMVGSYVFETARRNHGGKYYWMQEEEQPILVVGEPDFSVSIKAWEITITELALFMINSSSHSMDSISRWFVGSSRSSRVGF